MRLKKFEDARYMQYLAALTASLSITICGTLIAWPSPSLTILTSDDSPIGRPITDEEGSWIVSLVNFSPIFITPLVAFTMEKYGRKFALLLSGVPMFIGWLLIIWGDSVWFLYASRFLAGTGVSFCNIVSSVYIGEIAEKDIRGKLGTSFSLLKLIGYLLVFSVGPFVSYKMLAVVCASVPLIFFASFYRMPESPYYLMKRGRKEEARSSLIELSCKKANKDAIDKKMLEIQETVDYDVTNKSSVWDLFKRQHRKSLLLMFGNVDES